MTGTPVFDQVFSEPVGDPETFPGFLLMYHGQQPPAPAPGFPATRLVDQRALAAAYGEATFAAIDLALENTALPHRDAVPEAAYPALFLARHTLELYLKGLIPDWGALKGKQNAHQIDYLADHLARRINGRYHADHVEILSRFLNRIHAIDPRSAAFRFPDGAERDFSAAEISPLEVEFWINFQALRDSLKQVFEALDKIWAEARPPGLRVKE
ncbi:hypothetical protein GCM10011452_10270 [Gemmobacter lanyuensis]|uniref:HEPN domain-containing protein n=1 Tax=Gemmobacter lanyuensis TaxID=1054497 RepID=A0A918MH33_9RHOB|nr:hypothetical protein [Gemmobacter lanyuensis]GGW24822.1 hypothetical protein GCM10011452_10270 [Gemmobacter lanyuensis]